MFVRRLNHKGWTQPLPATPDDGELDEVVVQPITSLLPEGVQLELLTTINPLGPSSNYGVDLYRSTLEFVFSHLT